jgi:MOFRL family
LEAAARQSFDYIPLIGTASLQGEASVIGRRLVELVNRDPSQLVYDGDTACFFSARATFDTFRTLIVEHKRFCLLLGGETTVVMKNGAGKGGRCQELALSAALAMAKDEEQPSLLLLAAGSDGIDGPTDAAGAFAFKGMFGHHDDIARARAALDQHDAYTFWSTVDNGENLLRIGHTSTNVMDIIIVLVDRNDA